MNVLALLLPISLYLIIRLLLLFKNKPDPVRATQWSGPRVVRLNRERIIRGVSLWGFFLLLPLIHQVGVSDKEQIILLISLYAVFVLLALATWRSEDGR